MEGDPATAGALLATEVGGGKQLVPAQYLAEALPVTGEFVGKARTLPKRAKVRPVGATAAASSGISQLAGEEMYAKPGEPAQTLPVTRRPCSRRPRARICTQRPRRFS